MRGLYSLLLYLLTPLVLARLLWRSRQAPAYRRRWGERFGYGPRLSGPAPIWLHAVSVGEVQAALPLVRALLERHPDIPLLVTTTTPTGSARVREALGERVQHCYLPYDLPQAVRRFLRRARPRLGLVVETELWPNLYHQARHAGIPLLLANARLSERSARGYARIRPLVARTLACLDLIAAQGRADAERLRQLGAPPARTQVFGSIKFDLTVSAAQRGAGRALRGALGEGPVWIAASTHEGEEAQVLAAHRQVRMRHPQALLILVPRHPERFTAVDSLCERAGFTTVARSREPQPRQRPEVYLGDTMGELLGLYAAADVAFVGGSLTPVGGHNPLEPAALGLPVLAGPQVFNFQEIMGQLLEVGAARQVADAEQLAGQVCRLLSDQEERRGLGRRGTALVEANRGALGRLLEAVEARL